MNGEFRGDFSRDTFDPSKHFMRVLMQQGRVSLDADWNEQTAILLHYMQTLARDLIGPFAGPEEAGERGFNIAPSSKLTKSFNISMGRYYVDGILCENELNSNSCKKIEDLGLEYNNQPDFPLASDSDYFLFEKEDLPFLAYLDVWERHISYIEDDDIREKALGVADTASRSKIVWQVKALKSRDEVNWKEYVKPANGQLPCDAIRLNWNQIVENVMQNSNRGCLKARAKKTPEVSTEPCITSPESSYRGEENQLYRVEIHKSGFAEGSGKSDVATFKWSRDNGTVAFPVISKKGNVVVLEHLGRDNRLSLEKDDWVEVVDDEYTLLIQSRPSPLAETRPLAQVDTVDMTERTVTLRLQDSSKLPDYPENGPDRHPMLRRWDHEKGDQTLEDEPKLADDGALVVEENKWLTLEDGVQIWLQNSLTASNPVHYQTGDYWLVPARTATGDVEWPQDPDGNKLLLPPHGIDHHYAPLAYIDINTDGKWAPSTDCRCVIKKALNPPCYKNPNSQ